jgi:hypothetical protein
VSISISQPRTTVKRTAYAASTVALVAAVAVAVANGGAWWQIPLFAIGPDAALFLGFGGDLERGQLHPRAVPTYNALHRMWGPVLLGALALAVLPGLAVAALTWACHITLDRAIGYGLRTSDGHQRS